MAYEIVLKIDPTDISGLDVNDKLIKLYKANCLINNQNELNDVEKSIFDNVKQKTIKILGETDDINKLINSKACTKYDKVKVLSIIMFYKRYNRIKELKQKTIKAVGLLVKEQGNILTNIEEPLANLIGQDNLHHVSKIYQSGKAKKEYYSAIETHTEGRAYMNMLEQMYFLNDDFNDKSFHFSVASERYRINTGYIMKKIEKHKMLMKKSGIFQHENYMKTT